MPFTSRSIVTSAQAAGFSRRNIRSILYESPAGGNEGATPGTLSGSQSNGSIGPKLRENAEKAPGRWRVRERLRGYRTMSETALLMRELHRELSRRAAQIVRLLGQ